MRSGYLIAFWVACVWPLTFAEARTLEVGPGKPFALPSQAAEVAGDGDFVQIAPGNYIDCAIWTSNNLTIEAAAPGVVLSDKSCDGKGIFVITGNDVIVRGITFQRAVVPDGSVPGFVSYECGGHRVIASRTRYIFTARSFYNEWQQMVSKYHLQPGSKIWVAQMGWYTYVEFELENFPQFQITPHDFGPQIQIFSLTVGQTMPDPKQLPTT
jgi:hypothetical protein